MFFSPAAQSLLPSVVRDDELVAANSGIWTAAVSTQIAVAPLAALLPIQVGFGPAFAVSAVSFALSANVLRGLPEPKRPPSVQVSNPFAHAREALGALGQVPLLKALAAGQFLAALSAGATSALLVVLAQERLGGGQGYGVLVAAIGAGAALGPLLLLRRIKDPRRPLYVFGPYAVRGLVDLALVVVTSVPLAAAALVVYGLSTSTGSVTFSSLVQSRVPVALRGRAFAGFDVLWQSGRMLPARRRTARRHHRDPRRLPARRSAAAGRGRGRSRRSTFPIHLSQSLRRWSSPFRRLLRRPARHAVLGPD